MREIKFRAWEGAQKKFYYFSIYGNNAVIRETPITQFTGLKDKNGKEIYEGDILKVQGLRKRHVVEFGQQVDNPEYEGSAFGYAFSFNFRENEVEIIGNIHENLELLIDKPLRKD